MTADSKRRWFRFSLRTLFVVVTVTGCFLAYELRWLRERREILSNGLAVIDNPTGSSTRFAPGALWLFGERGVGGLLLVLRRTLPPANEKMPDRDEIPAYDRVRRAFPEADIVGVKFVKPSPTNTAE